MKKSIKLFSIFCVVLVVISLFPVGSLASEDKFVKLKVTSIDDSGNKNVNEELFYCKNNELYISNYTIIKYTMYDYDEKNNAFVRLGQTYKNSTSKVKINEADNTVDVWSLLYHETQDCDIYKFNEYYFLPLAKIASYLKASIINIDDNSIYITSSGYSIADAMYNFNKDVKFMDDIKIIDDLFYGNESAYKGYCILGYMGETIFDFKLSNIVGLGSYETYCDIMESAVNNNDVYEELLNNDNLLSDVLKKSNDAYENIYKKISKVPKLSSSAITTMFDEYKENNSFDDTDTAFDNFFESEELKIAPIKELGSTIKKVNDYVDTANYICNYYRMNEDNKSALKYVSSVKSNSNEMLAIKYVGGLYSDDFVKKASANLVSIIGENSIGEVIKKAGLSKVELAANITNEVFKLLGFDLSDNSSYDIMLANDLKRTILNNCEEYQTEKLLKPSNSENLRLAMIMTLLVEIEAYNMANKVAKKTDLVGFYDDDIEYLNKRLALFYKSKESQHYDDFESMKKLCVENQQQLQKIDLTRLSIVTQDKLLTLSNDFIDQLCSSQWYMIDNYYDGLSDIYYNFTEDGYVIETPARDNASSKFKYNTINDTCINFSYDNNNFNYTIYQTESENVFRYESKKYGVKSQGLLVKTEDKNNSESILNILAGGCWYSEYHERKYTMDMVCANGDGNGNTTLNFGFFPNHMSEGYTLYGKGITDYLSLFVPSEYVNSNSYIFVEYNTDEVDVNAYIFDEGEFTFEKWESYFDVN